MKSIGLAAVLGLISIGNQDAPRSAPGSEDPQRLEEALVKLTRGKLVESDQHLARAEDLLGDGRSEAAHAAIQLARRNLQDAEDGFRWIGRLGTRLHEFRLAIGDVSLVKARIIAERPMYPSPETRDAGLRAANRLTRFVVRVGLDRDVDKYQRLHAELVEIGLVGKRYPSGSQMRERFPAQIREDLVVGASLELKSDGQVRMLDAERDYWIAITAPVALKAIPRAIGAMGSNWLVFALPAESR
jgi:hypothetical protein